jgi:hypothetical protein
MPRTKVLIRDNMQGAGPQQAAVRYKTRDLHPEARKHPDGWVAYCLFKREAEKPVRYFRRDPAQKCKRQMFVFILYRLNRIILQHADTKNKPCSTKLCEHNALQRTQSTTQHNRTRGPSVSFLVSTYIEHYILHLHT